MLGRDPGKQEAWRRRSKPLRRTGIRPRSKRTIREQPIRADVRVETILLAAGRCQAPQGLGGITCTYSDLHDWEGNPTGHVHEVIRRGRRPGVHLDVTLTVYLCWAHHRLVTVDELLGRSAGLCWRSHEVDEARAAVAAIRAGGAVAGGAA